MMTPLDAAAITPVTPATAIITTIASSDPALASSRPVRGTCCGDCGAAQGVKIMRDVAIVFDAEIGKR
jgi:hypothetical protein